MGETFLVIAVLLALLWIGAWLWTITGSDSAWNQIGGGPLSMDGAEARSEQPATGAAADAERDLEIRQMLDARNARRRARGEPEVDVEDELRRLTRPAADPALVAEIRAHLVAGNERRARRGRPPLDIEREIARRLEELDR